MQHRRMARPGQEPDDGSRWVTLHQFTLDLTRAPSIADQQDGPRPQAQLAAALGPLALPVQPLRQIEQAVNDHLAALCPAGRPVRITIRMAFPYAHRSVQALAAVPGWGLFTVARETGRETAQPFIEIDLFLYPAGQLA